MATTNLFNDEHMQEHRCCWLKIFQHLEGESLFNASQVCTTWQEATEHSNLWKRVRIDCIISSNLIGAPPMHLQIDFLKPTKLDHVTMTYDKEFRPGYPEGVVFLMEIHKGVIFGVQFYKKCPSQGPSGFHLDAPQFGNNPTTIEQLSFRLDALYKRTLLSLFAPWSSKRRSFGAI